MSERSPQVNDCDYCRKENKTSTKFYWKLAVSVPLKDSTGNTISYDSFLKDGYFCSTGHFWEKNPGEGDSGSSSGSGSGSGGSNEIKGGKGKIRTIFSELG